MATNIFLYDGTLLATVPDGTMDSTHSSLRFPGDGYQNYSQPVLENILWTMQNFAAPQSPARPVTGQCWYDTNTGLLKVYNGTAWAAAGGVIVNNAAPLTGSGIGSFWYNNQTMQLYVWNGLSWDLVGPLGATNNADPISNITTSTHNAFESVRYTDNNNRLHQAWRTFIGGTCFMIVSKDDAYSPSPAIPGFTTIYPGINFNSTLTNTTISGDATLFKSTEDNIPDTDLTRSLGSNSLRFSSIYGGTGVYSTSLGVGGTSSIYNFQVTGTSNLNGAVSIAAGTTASPPLLLQTGNLTVAPSVGAIEFDGANLYVTLNVSGTPARKVLASATTGGSTTAIPYTLALRDGNADIFGNVFHGTATSALYADIAERYEADCPIEPGDVVILGGSSEITTTTVPYNPEVFGVVSTNPAFRMNEAAGDDNTHPFVAMVGRVPCKVVGRVKKGQRLVTSNRAGVAMAAEATMPHTVFARSLEDKDSDIVSLIEVVLTGRT
jgi:hypothetical protein